MGRKLNTGGVQQHISIARVDVLVSSEPCEKRPLKPPHEFILSSSGIALGRPATRSRSCHNKLLRDAKQNASMHATSYSMLLHHLLAATVVL